MKKHNIIEIDRDAGTFSVKYRVTTEDLNFRKQIGFEIVDYGRADILDVDIEACKQEGLVFRGVRGLNLS